MKPTVVSVTEIPCKCGYLEYAANQPHFPICFDQATKEYQLQSTVSGIPIYHCPFCGGCAPKGERPRLFELISAAEESRLAAILSPIKTMRDAVANLVTPDSQNTASMRAAESGDSPPEIRHVRTISYWHLSEVADVVFKEHEDGHVAWRLHGKRIGQKSK